MSVSQIEQGGEGKTQESGRQVDKEQTSWEMSSGTQGSSLEDGKSGTNRQRFVRVGRLSRAELQVCHHLSCFSQLNFFMYVSSSGSVIISNYFHRKIQEDQLIHVDLL